MEEKQIINYTSFIKLLKDIFKKESETLSHETKQTLFLFFNGRGLTYNDIAQILTGAKKKYILSAELNEFVTVDLTDLVLHHCSEADIELYKRLAVIDNKFKDYYLQYNKRLKETLSDIDYNARKLKTPGLDSLMKKSLEVIRERNVKYNQDVNHFSEEELKQLYVIACIYNAITTHFKDIREKDRLADEYIEKKLFNMLLNNQQLKLKQIVSDNFNEFLDSLTTITDTLGENEVFYADDFKKLMDNTASLVYKTNASKATAVRELLKTYLTKVTELSTDEKEKEILTKTSVKSIVLQAGSLLAVTKTNMTEGLDLLMGKTIEEVLATGEYSAKELENKKKLSKNITNIKINGMTSSKHLHFIKNTPSLFIHLNLTNLSNSVNDLIENIFKGVSITQIKDEKKLEETLQKPIDEKIKILKNLGFDVSLWFMQTIFGKLLNAIFLLANQTITIILLKI